MTTSQQQNLGPVSTEAGGSDVVLRGRVTAPPETRTLPSGDEIATLRLSVPRRATPLGRRSRQTSDWVDCVGAGARVRRAVSGWQTGDEVEVTGVLRRRFQRSPTGMSTRLEVEVLTARRVRPGGHAAPPPS